MKTEGKRMNFPQKYKFTNLFLKNRKLEVLSLVFNIVLVLMQLTKTSFGLNIKNRNKLELRIWEL